MDTDANTRAPAPSTSPVVAAGDILAEKYRVEQVLGSGGMGVVVAAEHIELREKVAIKFLLDQAACDAELSERFLREARAAVKIKSEHVVRIIDVGRLPSGAPYMVMEYLDGEDLSQRIERGPLPIEDAVDYIIQSCEAMNVAHHSGIVHRDLKPANLFLTERPDGSPIIKVLDFGISKVSSPDAAQLSLTHTQAMMGSPLYMSPEQMRSSKDVDRRADIWSLGVILYELLTGDVPFSGSTFPEVLVKVMTEPAPPLRKGRPDAPEALEAVVRRCLAKAPGDRYPSVAALAVALAPFASARTVGLHARLERSLSGPAPSPEAASAGRELGATRIEGQGPPAALPSPAPAAAAASARAPERLAAGTHTSWEEAPERVVPPRPKLVWLGAAAFVLCAAGGALLWLGFGAPEPAATASPPPAADLPAVSGAPAAPAAPALEGADPEPSVQPTPQVSAAATESAPAPTEASLAAAEPRVGTEASAGTPLPSRRNSAAPRSRPASSARVARKPKPAAPAAPAPTKAPAPAVPASENRPPRALSIEFK